MPKRLLFVITCYWISTATALFPAWWRNRLSFRVHREEDGGGSARWRGRRRWFHCTLALPERRLQSSLRCYCVRVVLPEGRCSCWSCTLVSSILAKLYSFLLVLASLVESDTTHWCILAVWVFRKCIRVRVLKFWRNRTVYEVNIAFCK